MTDHDASQYTTHRCDTSGRLTPHDAIAALDQGVRAIDPASELYDELTCIRDVLGLLPQIEATLEWCERVHLCGKSKQTRAELRAIINFGDNV